MAVTWATVTIPLAHHDNSVRGQYRVQCRCYPSQDLVKLLESIAGKGDHGLWWTEDEAQIILTCDPTRNWVWVPVGEYDLNVDEYFSNHMTHMKFFFRDPKHAVLFKLTWL